MATESGLVTVVICTLEKEESVIADHETAFEKIPSNKLDEMVRGFDKNVDNAIQGWIDQGCSDVDEELRIPGMVKTCGRPTRMDKEDQEEQEEEPEDVLEWEAQSCFIDAIVEVLQRTILPYAFPRPDIQDYSSPVEKFFLQWKTYAQNGKFASGTRHARRFFWEHHFQKDTQNDCQVVYDLLTDNKKILLAESSFACFIGGDKKAHKIVCSNKTATPDYVFETAAYGAQHLPLLISMNDVISSQQKELQYDYPESFEVCDVTYKICGRVFATTSSGGHFFCWVKNDDGIYLIDNLKFNKVQQILGSTIHGRHVNTVYVFYKVCSTSSTPLSPQKSVQSAPSSPAPEALPAPQQSEASAPSSPAPEAPPSPQQSATSAPAPEAPPSPQQSATSAPEPEAPPSASKRLRANDGSRKTKTKQQKRSNEPTRSSIRLSTNEKKVEEHVQEHVHLDFFLLSLSCLF
ncbi:unnamed protein product [Absidia cylindrospora]